MPDDDSPDPDDYINLSPYFQRDTQRAARVQYYVFTVITVGLLLATVGFSTALIADVITVDRGSAITTILIIGLAVSSIGFNGAFDEHHRWRYMSTDNDIADSEAITETPSATQAEKSDEPSPDQDN